MPVSLIANSGIQFHTFKVNLHYYLNENTSYYTFYATMV